MMNLAWNSFNTTEVEVDDWSMNLKPSKCVRDLLTRCIYYLVNADKHEYIMFCPRPRCSSIYKPTPMLNERTTQSYPETIKNHETATSSSSVDLQKVANYLLPILMVLIAVCFILGVTLIIKSYMMDPIKQNLITAIRRRRRVGHAPDNQYIAPSEMRASIISVSDRKSLPPPEVLMAARDRASQIMQM